MKKVTTKGNDLSQMSVSGASTMNFVKSKIGFEGKKDYGQSLQELKAYNKPNLDDGNRFFDDVQNLYENFGGTG